MKELGINYLRKDEYRELFDVFVDSNVCESFGIGITNDGELLYIDNKLMNNSSAYWMQSTFYNIDKAEFRAFLNQARSGGYVEKAIKLGQTTEEELEKLS